jgi:small-conductance mechanosensitive channel
VVVPQPDSLAVAAAEGAVWAERLERLGGWLEPILGSWVRNHAALWITWAQLLVAALVLGITGLVALLLRGWIHRWSRREEEEARKEAPPEAAEEAAQTSHVLKMTIEAALPPLMVIVAIWGLYAAASLLFVNWPNEAGRGLVLHALDWIRDVGGIVALFWFLYRMICVLAVRLRRWSGRTRNKWDDVLATMLVRALRLLVPLAGVILIVPTLRIPEGAQEFFRQGFSLLLIAAVGFIAYQLATSLEKAILSQYKLDVPDNLDARKIATQVQVLRKLAVVVIVLLTVASMLMVFESVRQLGTSILASAGVAGIVVGFAAQKSIATIVAGFQIAITQPIRIDDVVIVEGEWGRIEEITLTYVVVKIWDQRRLVTPINYFIEQPFQNWTRVSSELLGAVILHADYSLPAAELRAQVEPIVKAARDWDGKFWNLQITDVTERTIQIRILVTARDAGSAFNLRCEVREKVLQLLQQKYPQSLPRVRAELPMRELSSAEGLSPVPGGAS